MIKIVCFIILYQSLGLLSKPKAFDDSFTNNKINYNNNNFINHNLLIKNTNVLLQSYFKNISNYLIKNFQNSLRMS
jgi:hypothetical protein